MERLEALATLRDAVRIGEFPAEKSGSDMGFEGISAQVLYNVFAGSLDAALELHEEVLPRWGWRISGLTDAELAPPRDLRRIGHVYAESTNSGYASRAWLLAILQALIEQEQDGNAANPAPTSANRAGK